MAISLERPRRRISLVCEIPEEFLHERIPVHLCAISTRHSYSGFSTTYRRSVGLERPLIWLLKIGGGLVEMSSYPFKTNSG